ncbi:MAG TPA: ATP-binding protein [Actinokineospora sp.]|nr:ATP-binding protein [Actinokineospora sp.]
MARLIGRDSELAALSRGLTDARRGRSGLAVCAGATGTGKSTLVSTLIADADNVAMRVRWASGLDSPEPPPYWILRQVLAGDAEPWDGDGGELARLLTELGADSGILVVVEDIQWADEPSLGILAELLRAGTGRFLVCATLREPDAEPSAGWLARGDELLGAPLLEQRRRPLCVGQAGPGLDGRRDPLLVVVGHPGCAGVQQPDG